MSLGAAGKSEIVAVTTAIALAPHLPYKSADYGIGGGRYIWQPS